jgi:hypothetical protein
MSAITVSAFYGRPAHPLPNPNRHVTGPGHHRSAPQKAR